MLFPGHKYLGPGNSLDNGLPVDKDDVIAKEHDIEYDLASTSADIRKADRVAIKKFSSDFIETGNWHSLIGSVGLGIKYGIESVTGVIYPRMKGVKRPFSSLNEESETDFDTPAFRFLGKLFFNESMSDEEVIEQPEKRLKTDGENGESGDRSKRSADGPGGSGGKSTTGSGDSMLIYKGLLQQPNRFVLNYRKTYHFYMNATLPKYGYEDDGAFVHFVPGSCHDIPWNYLFCYVSPREANMLRTQFTEVRAVRASCVVSSLGVRLPFETNSSVSVTANANAQYPICEWIGVENNHYTLTKKEYITKLREVMIGHPVFSQESTGSSVSDSFTNIYAQCASRHFENPLNILLPRPTRKTYLNNEVMATEQYLNVPQMYQYVQMVNGSNHLGPVFARSYVPKNGLLFSRNTNQTITEPVRKNERYGVLYGKSMTYMTNFTNIDNIRDIKSGEYIPAFNSAYERVTLENQYQTSIDNPIGPGVQPRFLIGMVPIRNKDHKLLDAQWEFIVDFDLDVVVTVGSSGYYGRNETWPEPNFMHPNIQPGNYKKTLTSPYTDMRLQKGMRRLKVIDTKIPVQNRAVKDNGFPVDQSIEGFASIAVKGMLPHMLYDLPSEEEAKKKLEEQARRPGVSGPGTY